MLVSFLADLLLTGVNGYCLKDVSGGLNLGTVMQASFLNNASRTDVNENSVKGVSAGNTYELNLFEFTRN